MGLEVDTRLARHVAVRAAFVALLVAAVAAPHLASSAFEFPAVSNGWVLLVFAALTVIPLLEEGRAFSVRHLDAVAVVLPACALALEGPQRPWAIIALTVALAYLGARMFVVARARPTARRESGTPLVPRSWLTAGLLVLAFVHVSWAWQSKVTSDSQTGAVQGATRLLEGRSIYGASATLPAARHGDVYGPALYEAYTPFTGTVGGRPASRLLGAAAELLCALLLFILGRRLGGRDAGLLLSFCWLAYPLTLYEDALGFSDGLLAAALLGVLLVAGAPAKRGALAAIAAWVKFTPLALVPLLAAYRLGPEHRAARVAAFAAGFAGVTALVFVPVLLHDSPTTFVERTIGYQDTREPANSLWSTLQDVYGYSLPGVVVFARVLHGLVVAGAAALALLAPRLLRREDEIGLAAMCAVILIAVQISLSYYSYGYVLWFAPLMLVGLFAARGQPVRVAERLAVRLAT